jgi:phosphohistidine swiveling domain-containing protein
VSSRTRPSSPAKYGLPAVVATSNGTSTLVDGEEVVVDGNRGTVERVAR